MRDVKEMLMLDKLRDPSIISKGRRNFDMEITGRHGGCLDMTLPEALDKILSLKKFFSVNSQVPSCIQDDHSSSFWEVYLMFHKSAILEYAIHGLGCSCVIVNTEVVDQFISGKYTISQFIDTMAKTDKMANSGTSSPISHDVAGCVLSIIIYITSNASSVQSMIYEYYSTNKESKNDDDTPSELQTMTKPESSAEAVVDDMLFGDKRLPDILASDDVINGEYMRATKDLYTNTDPDMERFWKTYLDMFGKSICEDIINRRNITDVIMIAELKRFISGETTVHSLEDVITKRLTRKDPKHQLLVFKDYIKSYILTNMDKIALVQTAHMESKSVNTPGRLSLYDLVIFRLTKADVVNSGCVDDPNLYTEKKIILQNWEKILNTFFVGHPQNHAHSVFTSFVGKDGLQPIDFDGATLNYDDFCNVYLFMQEFEEFCDHVVIFMNNYIHDQNED